MTTFDEDLFETRLESLKDTQEGIQQMSSWCLQQRTHHKKIVACWLNVLKRVRVEHRLVMFYLANDVIQYSKRKHYEFVESWATALQRATTMVRDEKVKGKILRIFKIWEQREIYNEEYLSDLNGLLNINHPKKSQPNTEASYDFQSASLISSVREVVELSNATDKSFKKLPKAPHCDIDNIKQQIKDKSHSEDVEKEIERYITYIEAYNKNLQAEIKTRKNVLSNLDTAVKFYANQRVEVKVVVSAYKNFGSRIKLVKKKLDDISPNLPSPIPSPDINAPSPEPDADLQLPDEQTPISINLIKSNINGYSSYLDGNLPFDINDFKRDENMTNRASSQPIEVIGSRSDDESYNPSTDYYKPESISAYSSGSNISIPGLNPMPVPPVQQSEYTSLARSSQQYGNILPPPNPPQMFGNNHSNNNLHHNNAYGTHIPNYSGDNSSSYHPNSVENNAYATNSQTGGANNMRPLMPPPPIPSNTMRTQSNSSSDDFNSTWDMSRSWTSMDNSVLETPVSPPHFEREAHNAGSAAIEYSEHENSMVSARDVDHRQLHLPPAFTIGMKLGLSKDKTRQLDIDHRNLISLTGSPGLNEGDKKSWLSAHDQDFRTNNSGDVDYRTAPVLQTIDTTSSMPSSKLEPPGLETHLLTPPPPNNTAKKSTSPQKSNASSSSESQKDDISGTGTRYDPTDMVVDMDMSDEDLDDIFREVSEEQQQQQLQDGQTCTTSASGETALQEANENAAEDNQAIQATTNGANTRPALLETPPEYVPPNIWESAPMQQQMNMSGYHTQHMGMEMQQQHQQQNWNQMPMQMVPPPPRPPFPLQFQYSGGSGGMDTGGRGRGRGWAHAPQNQYRSFSRGSPYFNRGGRGGGPPVGPGMRGAFRGKYRGNNAWI